MPSSSCSSRASARAGRLAGLDLAAGELPVAGVDLARRALREQERAVGPLDDRRGDLDITSLLLGVPAGPVARELVGDAPAARAALQRPLQRLFLALSRSRRRRTTSATARRSRGTRPGRRDRSVTHRPKRSESEIFSSTRLAGMDLVADVLGLEVLGHVLRHQVAAVRGGVDQQVLGGGGDRAVERHLERDIALLGAVEASGRRRTAGSAPGAARPGRRSSAGRRGRSSPPRSGAGPASSTC